MEKEILTYDGKKGSAELKFSYHPSWKKVEILSATVSNANGKVSSLTAKEINVMDSGWAASAPRYPAGKTLVANLPYNVATPILLTLLAMHRQTRTLGLISRLARLL